MPATPAPSKGSKKGMWERPLVAVSCKGIGGPQLAKQVMPEGGRRPVVGCGLASSPTLLTVCFPDAPL